MICIEMRHMEHGQTTDQHSGHDGAHTGHGQALLDLLPVDQATHVAISNGFWFNPSTWADGRIPDAGAKVLIPEGRTVLYAGRSDTELDIVRVDGTLNFSTQHNSKMIVDTLITNFNSKLSIGSQTDPVADTVKVELIIADNGPIDTNWDPGQLSRGVVALGEVEIHGQSKTVHLKVADAPMSGDSTLTLAQAPSHWDVGDSIVIAGTHHVDFAEDGSRRSQDEVRIITAINGNQITFDRALAYDHDTPSADLATSVANYTRNIVIASENPETTAVNERGHTMFMHNADVDVRYVEFNELGRTDKSQRLDDFNLEAVTRTGPNATIDMARTDLDGDGVDDAGAMTNIRGRYSVHFHEAGTKDGDDAGYMEGNAVWGSPGWGFVNHDSNVDFIENAAFGVFGAGFVGETGNETGTMRGNISIYNEGTSEQFEAGTDARAAFHGTLNQDLGYAGFGYWFNGRLIELEDNIAAGAGEAGFGWTTRGVDSIDPLSSTASNALLARGHTHLNHADDAIISVFENNEAISSWKGLLIDGLGAIKNHDGYNKLTDFTAWGIEKTGLEISYSSKYLIDNAQLYSDKAGYDSFGVGARIAVSTEQVTIKNSDIDGFRRGVVNVNQTNSSKGDEFIEDREINLINVGISGNVGASVETTSSRSVPTKIFDSVEDLPGHHLNLVFDDSSLQFTNNLAEIRAMFPNFSTAIQDYKNQPGLMVRGTKYDSLGITDYPLGNEMARFDRTGVNEILAQDGFSTLHDGTKVVILGELITDRVTGAEREKYFVTELPDWWLFDGREIDKGAYVHHIGVYRPGFIAAANVPSYSTERYEHILAAREAEQEAADHNAHGAHSTDAQSDQGQTSDHEDHTAPSDSADQNGAHSGDHTDSHQMHDPEQDQTEGPCPVTGEAVCNCEAELCEDETTHEAGAPHNTDAAHPSFDHTGSGAGTGSSTHGSTQHTDPEPAVDQTHDLNDGLTDGHTGNSHTTTSDQTNTGHNDGAHQDMPGQNSHTPQTIGHDNPNTTPDTDIGIGIGHSGRALSGHLDAGRFVINTASQRIEIDTDGDGVSDDMVLYSANAHTAGHKMGLLLRHDTASTNYNVVRAPAAFSENKRLDSSEINGIVDEDFLQGNTATGFHVEVLPASGAKYANTVGVYEYSASGVITDVQIITTDARSTSQAVFVSVEPNATLGFFVVQNGGNTLPAAVLTGDNLGLETSGGVAQLTHNGAAVPGAVVFVSHDASLNPDGLEHVLSGADPDNSGGMIIGFEDKMRNTSKSDDDFQDVVMLVRSDVTASATLSVSHNTDPADDTIDQVLFAGEGAAQENATYSHFVTMAANLGVTATYADLADINAVTNALDLPGLDRVLTHHNDPAFTQPDVLTNWAGDKLVSNGWAQNWTLYAEGLAHPSSALSQMAASTFDAAWTALGGDGAGAIPLSIDAPIEAPSDAGAYLAANVLIAATLEQTTAAPNDANTGDLSLQTAQFIHDAVLETWDHLA